MDTGVVSNLGTVVYQAGVNTLVPPFVKPGFAFLLASTCILSFVRNC